MLRVTVMVVWLFIIIVALSMVLVVKLMYIRNGPVMTGGLGFLRHNGKISQELSEIMGHHSPLQW